MTELPHASRNPGVMHACGHDGHTTSLLGAAALLLADTGWSGTVHFVFQTDHGEISRLSRDGLILACSTGTAGAYLQVPLIGPGLDAGTIA